MANQIWETLDAIQIQVKYNQIMVTICKTISTINIYVSFLLVWRLETTLRNFSCLTTGDSIMVAYNNKQYYIDIIETKPAPAISIIETDCEVDFAPPLDYKEPVRPSINNAQTTGKKWVLIYNWVDFKIITIWFQIITIWFS